MIFADDPRWDSRWDELDRVSMELETATIPFSAEGYLEEFYSFYEIRDRSRTLAPAGVGFVQALEETCGDGPGAAIAAKAEALFGPPKRVLWFEDDKGLLEELEGPDGLAPLFFVFGLVFCEYEGFTLCFMSGTNN